MDSTFSVADGIEDDEMKKLLIHVEDLGREPGEKLCQGLGWEPGEKLRQGLGWEPDEKLCQGLVRDPGEEFGQPLKKKNEAESSSANVPSIGDRVRTLLEPWSVFLMGCCCPLSLPTTSAARDTFDEDEEKKKLIPQEPDKAPCVEFADSLKKKDREKKKLILQEPSEAPYVEIALLKKKNRVDSSGDISTTGVCAVSADSLATLAHPAAHVTMDDVQAPAVHIVDEVTAEETVNFGGPGDRIELGVVSRSDFELILSACPLLVNSDYMSD